MNETRVLMLVSASIGLAVVGATADAARAQAVPSPVPSVSVRAGSPSHQPSVSRSAAGAPSLPTPDGSQVAAARALSQAALALSAASRALEDAQRSVASLSSVLLGHPPPSGSPPGRPQTSAPSASAPLRGPIRVTLPQTRYTSWDVNIDLGYGKFFGAVDRMSFTPRLRAGVLVVRDPWYWQAGLTYEWSTLSHATIGMQGDVVNIDDGYWLQAGLLLDVDRGVRPGAMGALGYKIFGVEVQARQVAGGDVVPAVFGKIRLPIGILVNGLIRGL